MRKMCERTINFLEVRSIWATREDAMSEHRFVKFKPTIRVFSLHAFSVGVNAAEAGREALVEHIVAAVQLLR